MQINTRSNKETIFTIYSDNGTDSLTLNIDLLIPDETVIYAIDLHCKRINRKVQNRIMTAISDVINQHMYVGYDIILLHILLHY